LQSKEFVYCDICGTSIEKGKERHINLEGTPLTVCSNCFTRLDTRNRKKQETQQSFAKPKAVGYLQQTTQSKQQLKSSRETVHPGKPIAQNVELVEDYAERIRKAREKLGWSQAILAERIKVSENIVKRIESGKLRPTLDLAKKIEEVLGIKLLMPSIEEELKQQKIQRYVTLGEIVNVRTDENNI